MPEIPCVRGQTGFPAYYTEAIGASAHISDQQTSQLGANEIGYQQGSLLDGETFNQKTY
jgi:hypothetical protein